MADHHKIWSRVFIVNCQGLCHGRGIRPQKFIRSLGLIMLTFPSHGKARSLFCGYAKAGGLNMIEMTANDRLPPLRSSLPSRSGVDSASKPYGCSHLAFVYAQHSQDMLLCCATPKSRRGLPPRCVLQREVCPMPAPAPQLQLNGLPHILTHCKNGS